ncbi:hypothetical protein NH26_22025 [Flammeovirga pacifica]|uniref:CBM-cenC domain-containing protein n=2 Tax=Flammeovirga pacifica TaxID=915059 RepID=A0A1S1YTC4_FLAPC|nr:hypothetical protein NH26_22025 [Flammeovirga pacifica]
MFITALVLIGCSNDIEEKPAWSDVSWYTESGGFAHYNLMRRTGEAMSFMDLSQGVYSHEWVLDSGNYFIESEYPRGEDLTKYIIPELDRSTTNTTINVLFTESGPQGVRLNNAFYHPVKYIGLGSDNSADTIESYLREDGMWVIDTTFYVDVFAELQPVVQIENAGDVIAKITQDLLYIGDDTVGIPYDATDNSTWKEVNVPLGEEVIYKDLTTIGRPETRTWTFPDNAQIIDFYYDEAYTEAETSSEVTLKFVSTKRVSAGAILSERLKPDVIAESSNLRLPLYLVPQAADVEASYVVYHNDVAVLTINEKDIPSDDQTTWQEIEVEKGDQLKLVDMTTKGVVDYSTIQRDWAFDDGTSSSDSVAYAVYNTLTSGEEYFTVGSFTINRDKDGSIPASKSSKLIPLKVKVQLESRPTFKEGEIIAERNELTETSGTYDKVIAVYVSENLQDITDQTLAKNSFTVMVSNAESGLASTSFQIEEVKVNETDRKRVEIRLTEEFYNSDEITVAYNGESNAAIQSEAGVSLENFAEENIVLYRKQNVFNTDLAGFEVGNERVAPFADGWFNQKVTTWLRNDTQAHTGTHSLRFFAANQAELNNAGRDRIQSTDSHLPLGTSFKKGDQVRVKYYLYVPSATLMTDGLTLQFQNPNMNLTPISTDITKDQWVEQTVDMVIGSDFGSAAKGTTFTFALVKASVEGGETSDAIEFFIDDISIEYYEVRP